MEMDVNDEIITTKINNGKEGKIAEIIMNTADEYILIKSDTNIPASIKIDSATGLITIASDSVKIDTETRVTLNTTQMDINSSITNVNSDSLVLNAKQTNIVGSAIVGESLVVTNNIAILDGGLTINGDAIGSTSGG
jgi:hypothetical protein